MPPANHAAYKNPAHNGVRLLLMIAMLSISSISFDADRTDEILGLWTTQDGKAYSCKISLISNGNLRVRGYVGISLFGRTEICAGFCV